MSNTNDFTRLKRFLWVKEAGSIKAAAVAHRLNQSTVSREMKELESELGVTLLARTLNRATPTPAGEYFAREVSRIVEDYEQVCQQVRNLGAKRARRLRVGHSPSPTEDFRAAAFARFERANAKVRVAPREIQVAKSMQQLLQGKLELALVVQPLSVLDASLRFEKLTEREVFCVVGEKHRFATKGFVTPDEIRGETILGFSRDDLPQYYEYFAKWFEPAVPEMADDYCEAKTLLDAVARGPSITVLFSSAGLIDPRVRMVPIQPPFAPVGVGAMYVRPSSPTIESFITEAKAVIAGLPSREKP